MTYEEFVKGISEHPAGWRYGFMDGDIYLHAISSTQEEGKVLRDSIHLLYEVLSNDPGAAVKMLKTRSDLYKAAIETWLKQ